MKIETIEVDKSTIIFLAIYEDGVMGKCSLKLRTNKTIRYFDAYTNPKDRGKGVYKALFHKREEFVKNNFSDWQIESYCKESTIKLFKNNGIEVVEKLYLVSKTCA